MMAGKEGPALLPLPARGKAFLEIEI